MLYHYSASCYLVAVADLSNPKTDEVAATKLAVDSEIEEGKLAHSAFHLEAHAECPDVFALNGAFCPQRIDLVETPRRYRQNASVTDK